MRWLPVLCLALVLIAGCDEDAERTLTPPATPEYLANESPDNVIANLVTALEAMDPAGYAALLYDGIDLAADGLTYAAYKFCFYQNPSQPPMPEFYLYERELACMAAMLGGEPGMDSYGNAVPGLHGFDLELAVNGVWAAPSTGLVDEDSYPAGTVWRLYDTSIGITLKSTYGGSVNGWSISDRLLAYCIPVQVDGETEYRLWKWREIIGYKRAVPLRGVESASLGMVKLLYGD